MRSSFSTAILAAALAIALPLAGCAKKAPGPVDSRPTIGLVTDAGGLGDRSFNDQAYAALNDDAKQMPFKVDLLESHTSTDYFSNLTLMATKNTDQTIAIGFDMASDVVAVARRWPKRNFAIIDAVADVPNVTSVTFKEQDGAFLAGALAAIASKTHTVAFLGGGPAKHLAGIEDAFAAGAKEINPHANVLVTNLQALGDKDAGAKAARDLFNRHADVIFVAASTAGLGAFDEVKHHNNAWLIGANTDQSALAPGKVLSSLVKRIDVAVLRICQDTVSQKPVSGQIQLGLADGAIGLTDSPLARTHLTTHDRAQLTAVSRAIVDHAITVPTTPQALAAFKPVPLGG